MSSLPLRILFGITLVALWISSPNMLQAQCPCDDEYSADVLAGQTLSNGQEALASALAYLPIHTGTGRHVAGKR